jgi:hypothetical protein
MIGIISIHNSNMATITFKINIVLFTISVRNLKKHTLNVYSWAGFEG